MSKPGVKSTEFWMALIALIGGGLLASGILVEQPEALRIVEIIVGVLAQLGYTASRTMLKKPNGVTAKVSTSTDTGGM